MEIRRLLKSPLYHRDLITTTTTTASSLVQLRADAERSLRWKLWLRIDLNLNVMFEMVSAKVTFCLGVTFTFSRLAVLLSDQSVILEKLQKRLHDLVSVKHLESETLLV